MGRNTSRGRLPYRTTRRINRDTVGPAVRSTGEQARCLTASVRHASRILAAPEVSPAAVLNLHCRIVGLVMAILLSANAVHAQNHEREVPLHHFQLSCDSCHQPSSENSVIPETGSGDLKDSVNRLCASPDCHDFDPVLSHPLGVTAENAVPASMPLDSNSSITCLTCHSVPQTSGSANYADLGLDRSLRRPSGIQFCAECHMRRGGSRSQQSHWQFSARAHLGSVDTQTQQVQGFEPLTGQIDTESRTCLSCHDDITVTIPSHNETIRQKRARWKRMADHPIGMNYEHVATRQIRRYILPLTNHRLRLFNGRVGCGSCHSPYSPLDKNLIMRNQRSALCRQCHNM
jgi:predicted CXXCH cytochrome family protein